MAGIPQFLGKPIVASHFYAEEVFADGKKCRTPKPVCCCVELYQENPRNVLDAVVATWMVFCSL